MMTLNQIGVRDDGRSVSPLVVDPEHQATKLDLSLHEQIQLITQNRHASIKKAFKKVEAIQWRKRTQLQYYAFYRVKLRAERFEDQRAI